MAATIPADIIQYYGYMLRTAQKLMYLYGFPEISIDGKAQAFDSETLNMLTVCLGISSRPFSGRCLIPSPVTLSPKKYGNACKQKSMSEAQPDMLFCTVFVKILFNSGETKTL